MYHLDFLTEKDIFLDLNPTDKKDLIYQMVRGLPLGNKEKIFRAVVEREELSTTGIGEGIALPHCRTDAVKDIIIKFALLKNGIDFDALDKKDVNFVFLVIAPYTNTQGYLTAISRLVRIIGREEVKRALLNADTKKEILSILKSEKKF